MRLDNQLIAACYDGPRWKPSVDKTLHLKNISLIPIFFANHDLNKNRDGRLDRFIWNLSTGSGHRKPDLDIDCYTPKSACHSKHFESNGKIVERLIK